MRRSHRILLARQLRARGALNRGAAHQLGLTDHQLRTAVANGELERPRPSVYVARSVRRDVVQQLMEDVASWQPRAVVSHSAALALHGIRFGAVPFRRELTSPLLNGPERPRPPLVHRTRSLPDEDVTAVDGVPVTTVARTVVDLAPRLTAVARITLLDHVIVKGKATQAEMHACADRLRRGRRGVAELAALTEPDAAAQFFSRLERLGAPLLAQAGLVAPGFNVVPDRAPAALRCDVVSEADAIVVEWDGLRFHSSPASRQADNDKGNALAGRYHLLRFTWRDVMARSFYVVATVRRTRQRPPAGRAR